MKIKFRDAETGNEVTKSEILKRLSKSTKRRYDDIDSCFMYHNDFWLFRAMRIKSEMVIHDERYRLEEIGLFVSYDVVHETA